MEMEDQIDMREAFDICEPLHIFREYLHGSFDTTRYGGLYGRARGYFKWRMNYSYRFVPYFVHGDVLRFVSYVGWVVDEPAATRIRECETAVKLFVTPSYLT